MKAFYPVATVVGYAAANFLVVLESIQAGNILLWTKPLETMNAMFANRISTIFAIDLFFVVLVAFVWMYEKARDARIGSRLDLLVVDPAVRTGRHTSTARTGSTRSLT